MRIILTGNLYELNQVLYYIIRIIDYLVLNNFFIVFSDLVVNISL